MGAGRFRAKLPGTLGTWPAIWLLPNTAQYGWPTQGEIDIMENRGHQPLLTSSAYHWGPSASQRQFTFAEQEAVNGGTSENHHDDFHTYAVEWDATKLRFFVDDVHYHTITDAETGGFIGNQIAPMETVLNVAVGGDFLGPAQPNPTSVWPQQMLVDYVRVFERDPNPPPVQFRNGSFEEQGGSLAGWSVFGNREPNVQTHHEAPAIEGNETLKIFGQFTGNLSFSGVEQGISVSPGDSISATAHAYIRQLDDLAGGNSVDMKIDYYSEFGAKFGSPSYINSKTITIADAATANDIWHPHTLTDTVPAGAVEARLAFVFVQPGFDGGAIHIDDVTFANLSLEFSADANGDGSVDGNDFLSLQRGLAIDSGATHADGDFNLDGQVNAADVAIFESQYGTTAPATAAAAAIPEPATLLLCTCAALFSTWRLRAA